MKVLTAHAQALLAERGSRPVVLVTLTARPVEGGSIVSRWASQADGLGTYGYRIGGAGDLYRADLALVGRISRSLRPLGGIATAAGDDIVIANPDEDGELLSALLSLAGLDEATLAVDLVFADGAETPADLIRLAQGTVGDVRVTVQHLTLPWREDDGRHEQRLPTGRIISPELYPFAPQENWGRILPIVLGDLRGRAFDVSTPASGVFPHVPSPALNAQRQRFGLYDDADEVDRETLLRLYDQFIEIPAASRSCGSGYVQVDDNEFWLWLRPHRIDDTTEGVIDPEHACTHDLERYALLSAGTALYVHLPGASANLGQMGAGSSFVPSDVTVYVIYEKVDQDDVNPAQLGIKLGDVGLPGHVGISLNGSGIAVDVQEIGDHLSGWDDLRDLAIVVFCGPGNSGVRVRRTLVRVVFRCDEVGAAFDQQDVYRAQLGFVESATAPLDDYQDGDYLWGVRTPEAVANPVDIAEVLLRHRRWGLGLRATSLVVTGVTLSAAVYPTMTSWTVSDGSSFASGDLVLADREVVAVQSKSGNVLTVSRGAAGSRMTCHIAGTELCRFSAWAGSRVDSASFRGAASILQEPDGVEVLTNGEMEGSYTGGVAPGWSEYDPNNIGTCAATGGYTGRYAQQVTRTSATGAHPGVIQYNVPITTGQWYRLSLYVRSPTGASTIQISIVQGAQSLHPTFLVGTEWAEVTLDFLATASSLTSLRLRNAGGAGAVVQFDAASLQRLVPWRMGFALTEAIDARTWLDRTFLPQAGLRVHHGADGRLHASAYWPGRPSAMTLDASRIVVDQHGAPMIAVARASLDEVITGVVLRYAFNHLTQGYEGLVEVRADRSSTGQTVAEIIEGTPLDTLVVASGAELVPKDAAEETGNIAASGRTVTLPSGDLVDSDVAAGDWLIVQTSWGTFLHQIAQVLGPIEVELVELPPAYNDPGRWSAGNNLYLAGNEIFGTFAAPTAGSVTIFRGLDAINLTPAGSMAVGDLVWALASMSDGGTGAHDEGCLLRRSRERRALGRVARYRLVRTLSFDAPYIRDRQTAVFLRNHLFDAHDRGWLITLTTDLGTLALDVGDHVAVVHDIVPGGTLAGEIIRQSVDLAAGRIEYVIRG